MVKRIVPGALVLGASCWCWCWGAAVLRAHAQDAPMRSVRDGIYTQEQAARGEQLYTRECASCHGKALDGGKEGPPLTGPIFLANWNGMTVGFLFDRTRETMPSSNPGTLENQEYIDAIAYILSANKYPAGKAELGLDRDALKKIKFEGP